MSREARLRRLASAGSGGRGVVDVPAVAPVVPNIIEFVTSPTYLDRPRLYPAQALLLKVIFLAVELLTDRDREVLAVWGAGFVAAGEPGERRFEGCQGMPPDVLSRMEECRRQDRRWFREVVLVVGRRGSKGYLAALAAAYVVWRYLCLDDPQRHYGIESTKRLSGMVFAGEQGQAADNLFRDLAGLIESAPCFQPYVAARTKHSVTVCTPRDLREGRRPARELAASASLVIDARPTTGLAGRGPAGNMVLFDEIAHLGVDTARSADEMYEAAVPSLDQFGVDGFVMQASSPASQLGKFYASYRAALALNDDDTATDPTMLTVQLPSWGLYEGWESTRVDGGLPMVPGGPPFARLDKAVVSYDDAMRRAEAANPSIFAVERRAQWRTSMDSFLEPDLVQAVFAPYGGERLTMHTFGSLGTDYVIHVDPSTSKANYAIAIAHADPPDERGLRHVVVDAIHVRKPADYPSGRIDQLECFRLIQQLIAQFSPASVTFDQHQSALSINMLQAWCDRRRLPRTPRIHEQTATAPHNRRLAGMFKSAVQLGLVHAPVHDLARLELLHLQERGGRVDHPTYGPVQTSDVSDALFEVTDQLIGDDLDRWNRLGDLTLGMSQPGGMPISLTHAPPANRELPQFPNPSAGLASVRSRREGRGMPARGRHWR